MSMKRVLSGQRYLDKVYTPVYTCVKEDKKMEVAKVFMNGGSQAVRLPKNCRFEDGEVLATKVGDLVILMPKDDEWAEAKLGLSMFSDDFLQDGIDDLPLQERDLL